MNSYEDRILLEKSIIAELLSDPNAYVKVAGYLTEKNFSEKLYGEIYKACVNLYPHTAIEPFTIAEKSGISAITLLMESTHELMQNKNIKYRALLLVEHSIREQYISLLKSLHKELDFDTEKAISLSEIITYSWENESDIFKIISNTLLFFQSKKQEYEHELEVINEFNEKIVTKCERIRSLHHIDSIYYNLDNLYQFDYRKKELLKCMSKVTRYIMAHEVSPQLENHILKINTIL